jgi:hypothetical protein
LPLNPGFFLMKFKQRCFGLVLCLLSAAAGAHELPSNRLTLVLRDDAHVSLTYFIDYTEALHRTLAPERAQREFIVAYLAMKPADFDAALAKAHAKLSAGTVLALPSGEAVAIRNWRWPDPVAARTLLQTRVMQMLSGDGHPDHDAVQEVHAEATPARAFTALAIRLPEQLGRVLVVSYQPRQAWVEPRAASTSIKF